LDTSKSGVNALHFPLRDHGLQRSGFTAIIAKRFKQGQALRAASRASSNAMRSE
jgi:hypothetical protein